MDHLSGSDSLSDRLRYCNSFESNYNRISSQVNMIEDILIIKCLNVHE
jgi:hypothetical protein